MDDAVLGVSMTPSTVGLALVEGREADGATVHHDTFDIRGRLTAQATEVCDQVVSAVRRSEEVAAQQGRRLTTISVTWSSGAGAEAAMLLEKLTEAGFADVVPVRLPQATDALARQVAGIVGFGTTGVCVLEPDVVQAMTVDGDSPVQTTVSRGIETVAGLVQWLSDLFDTSRPRPDALVVVGSAVDLDSVLPKLEQTLGVPVFTPTEPGLPLARGAALATARRARPVGDDTGAAHGRRWPGRQLNPLAILVAGVLAFAVSLTLAIGQQLVPGPESTPHRTSRPVVTTSGEGAPLPAVPPTVTPVTAPSTPEPAPELEPVADTDEPEYLLDQPGTTTPVDPVTPSAQLESTGSALEPVAPESPATPPAAQPWQQQVPAEPDIPGPVPDAAPPATPMPPVAEALPPPAAEVLPPPPDPAAPPPEIVTPAPEAVPPPAPEAPAPAVAP